MIILPEPLLMVKMRGKEGLEFPTPWPEEMKVFRLVKAVDRTLVACAPGAPETMCLP